MFFFWLMLQYIYLYSYTAFFIVMGSGNLGKQISRQLICLDCGLFRLHFLSVNIMHYAYRMLLYFGAIL